MSRTLHILFNGSPDFPFNQRFNGVADQYNRALSERQVHYARWKTVQRKLDLWALEVDVVPLRRPRIIFLIGTSLAPERVDELMLEHERMGHVVLREAVRVADDDAEALASLDIVDLAKVEIADQVFVVNADGATADSIERIIERAESTETPVSYLEYV